MKQWLRPAGALLLAGALLVGCARGPASEEGAADRVQRGIGEAAAAAPGLVAAARTGDRTAFEAAYKRFASAFEQILAPISMEDPNLAARMANANTAIKAMVTEGHVELGAVEREVAVIRDALEESVTTMAQAAQPQERFTVVAQEYRFQPETIRVKKGSRVVIRLENRGTMNHEFEIESLDVEIGPIKPGTSAEASFVADKPGSYSYECHVDGHFEKGMKGTLIVEE